MSSKKLQRIKRLEKRIKRLEKRIPQKPLTNEEQIMLVAWIKLKEFRARTQPDLLELPDEPPPEEWDHLLELQREAPGESRALAGRASRPRSLLAEGSGLPLA